MKKRVISLCTLLIMTGVTCCFAQVFDLQQLLKEKKLITYRQNASPLTDGDKVGLSVEKIVWLKGVNFSRGTIDVDLRGKDVMQRSFIGIAFHGVDTVTYDCIYFRPFNFRSSDPVRKIHAVQYISHPDYSWDRLRDEKNGMYEKAVDPAPAGSDWFHARIVVGDTQVRVYVNHSTIPSLTVDKLNSRKDGLIGLWNGGLPGDFSNLVISK